MSERGIKSALTALPGLDSYWLASRFSRGGVDLFTLDVSGREMLPVFGHREDAEDFLRSRYSDERWRPRDTMAGEFASILMGPCAGVRWILLDPWPGYGKDETTGLASMEREVFLELVMDGGDPFKPAWHRDSSPAPVLYGIIGGKHPGRVAESDARVRGRRESVEGEEKECTTQ